MSSSYRRRVPITLWLVSGLYVVWALAFIWRSSIVASDEHRYFCLFDDAMVSMRYAWNLAHGRGCVWNAGEYVQGFTTPLMVGLMALPCAVLSKSAACLAVQLFGIFTVLAIAWYARRLCQLITDHRWLPVISFVAVLAYYPLSYWSLMGMETGVVCLCTLLAIYYSLRQQFLPGTVVMCLGFLARPDFLLVAALLIGFLFLAKRHNALVSAGVVAVLATLTFLAQYLYYGDPLPNSYTLKMVGYPVIARIYRGAGFVTPFLAGAGLLLAFAMAGVPSKSGRTRHLLLLVCCSVIGYQIYVGGDPWPYWRMLVPMMPALLVLVAVGAHAVLRNRTAATATAVLVALILSNAKFLSEMTFRAPAYKVTENAGNLNQAIALNRVLPPRASIGVLFAGVLPYFTDFRAIDFLGKNDRHIASLSPGGSGRSPWSETQATLPGHNKYDLSYSIGVLKPDFIQSYQYGHSDTSPWIRDCYEAKVVDGMELIVRKGVLP
jgi:arabinofuranosyltransferase